MSLRIMIMLLFIVCILSNLVIVKGDYDCMCNYNVETPVYDKPDIRAAPIGYMYEFDCKPVYRTAPKTTIFQAIQFENEVGYVEHDGNMAMQICQGSIPKEDAIKTTPPHTNALTSTTPQITITTRSTSITSPSVLQPSTNTSSIASSNVTTSSSIPPVTSSLIGLLTTSTNIHSTTHSNTQNPHVGHSHSTLSNNNTLSSASIAIATTASPLMSTTSPSTSLTSPATPSITSTPTTPTTSPTPTTLATSTSSPATSSPATPSITSTQTTTPTTSQTPTTTSMSTSLSTTISITTPTSTTTQTPSPTTTPMTTSPTTTTPTTTTSTIIPPPSCPSGWVMHGDSCYMFRTDHRRHWHDANNDCVQQSSHLVIIDTNEENQFITQQLNDRIDTHPDHDPDTAAWVAGTDDDQEGRWEWFNGLTNVHSQIAYNNWRPGQPDEGEHDHDEDCMCMVGNKGFVWEDYSCNEDMYYVCEKSALHTPHVPQVTQALVTGSQPHGTPKCDNGWIQHHDSCYKLHTDDRWHWSDANNYCQTHHAHLAIIDSAEENSFLANELRQRINVGDHDHSDTGTWVAGTDHDNEGQWMWMEGNSLKPVQYTNWHSGQPDHDDGDEDCMAMIGNENFRWYDYPCDEVMFFVCERSAAHTSQVTQVPQVTQTPGTGSQTQPHGAPKCDNGWIMHHESCYLLHTNNRWQWPRANTYCQTNNAHLAIIDSAEENNFLANKLSQHINVGDHDHSDTGAWVAGTDHDNEGQWMWMEGNSLKPVQYTNWQPGEPDRDNDDEDCMAIIGNENFRWHDYPCNEVMFFVCERSAFYTNGGSLLVGK